jgi:hypothetical protein
MRVLQTFKNPRWLAFYVSFGMLAVGYLGLRASVFLSQCFPEQHPKNMDFFAGFAFLVIPSYFLFFAGVICSVICCLGFLISGIIFLFRRKHPKQD